MSAQQFVIVIVVVIVVGFVAFVDSTLQLKKPITITTTRGVADFALALGYSAIQLRPGGRMR